jgi:hypothetical protein
MLIELWEKMRGFDQWPATEATIQSSKVKWYRGSGQDEIDLSRNLIAWRDAAGQIHRAKYRVHEGSPLFQLYAGKVFVIRYDPLSPNRFYSRDLLQSQIGFFLKQTLRTLVLAGLAILALWLRSQIRGTHR